jgi:hypothetical protein
MNLFCDRPPDVEKMAVTGFIGYVLLEVEYEWDGWMNRWISDAVTVVNLETYYHKVFFLGRCNGLFRSIHPSPRSTLSGSVGVVVDSTFLSGNCSRVY